jgi:hypothetical protein
MRGKGDYVEARLRKLYGWLSHTRGNDRGAGQLQVILRQVYNLSTWHLDCDNGLYTYQVDLSRYLWFPSYVPACSR